LKPVRCHIKRPAQLAPDVGFAYGRLSAQQGSMGLQFASFGHGTGPPDHARHAAGALH
jgi:hypothetical protein